MLALAGIGERQLYGEPVRVTCLGENFAAQVDDCHSAQVQVLLQSATGKLDKGCKVHKKNSLHRG
jgi:hypothetical protein